MPHTMKYNTLFKGELVTRAVTLLTNNSFCNIESVVIIIVSFKHATLRSFRSCRSISMTKFLIGEASAKTRTISPRDKRRLPISMARKWETYARVFSQHSRMGTARMK